MTAGRYETRYRRVHLPRIRWDDSLNLTRTVLSLSKLSSLRVIVGVPGYMYPGTRTLECKLAKKGPQSGLHVLSIKHVLTDSR